MLWYFIAIFEIQFRHDRAYKRVKLFVCRTLIPVRIRS